MNEFFKPDGPGKVMFKQSGGKIVLLTPEVRTSVGAHPSARATTTHTRGRSN
jgi:hypothetical protein